MSPEVHSEVGQYWTTSKIGNIEIAHHVEIDYARAIFSQLFQLKRSSSSIIWNSPHRIVSVLTAYCIIIPSEKKRSALYEHNRYGLYTEILYVWPFYRQDGPYLYGGRDIQSVGQYCSSTGLTNIATPRSCLIVCPRGYVTRLPTDASPATLYFMEHAACLHVINMGGTHVNL